jgi:hypothetical protein
MSPEDFINLLINIYIFCCFTLSFLMTYFTIVFIANMFGIYGILLDFRFFITDGFATFNKNKLMPALFWFITITTWLLFWIFCFWMSIIIFVPFFIIIPIPFIPFIVPVPLKMPMLLLIPPFKILTDRGILPLFRDNIFGFFFSEGDIKERLKRPFINTYGFLYEEIKQMFGDFFKLIYEPESQNISKDIEDKNYEIEKEENHSENERMTNDINNNKKNKSVNKIIKIEENICKTSNSKFATIDMSVSEIMNNSIMDNIGSTRCQMNSARSYINNLT